MLNYKEFMEALKQTIYSQTGWNSDCMGSLTDEGPTSDTALEIHYMNTDRDASVISIRVPELYARYQIGESITSIADSVIGTIREDDRFCLAQAVSQCKNYELAKEHLFISAESIYNEEALTQCIYQTVGDIAICPNLKLLDRNGKMIGLKVAPEFLKLWKTDENEVIKAAVRNSSKLYPARYYNFLKALFMQEYKGEDFMEEDSSSVLLEGNGDKCISTTILQHGAAAIFYPGVCRKICEVLGAESLYLVFTSVHEVMVSAVRADVSVEEMQRRLHNGSRTVKEPEEKLTEQVYCYDGKSNCIRLAKGEGNVFQCDE